jgi:hypothetical protein
MTKTIVYLADGTMHSAWHSMAAARKQVEVLKNNGYKGCYPKYFDHNYPDGHYFV